MLTTVIHLLVLLVFMNRYFMGTLLAKLRRKELDRVTVDYQPTVNVVIPMFNEGEGIYRTVKSLLAQSYPRHKLYITVVDDCSRDDSYDHACRAARESSRVRVLRNPVNMGKRRSINHAVRESTAEIIVSVDSDCVIAEDAIEKLIRRFVAPDIAAVGARVNVINKNDNWLTRMQTIKYFIGYEYLKNVERAYRSVMCLSGCLTAYRRHVLVELEPILEDRNVLGVAIKYGEDRFLTRQIVKAGYKTMLTLDAVAYTRVPDTMSAYFSQQVRWRRSNIIDYMGGMSHVWRLHPVVAIHYLAIFALLIAYPAFILESLSSGAFWESMFVHCGVVAAFGVVYRLHNSDVPENERVNPLWFLAMTVVMPITYLVLTPLALFTLDSGSWETRNHGDTVNAPEPESAPEFESAPEPKMAPALQSTIPRFAGRYRGPGLQLQQSTSRWTHSMNRDTA